ncbi:efflux RND transporter periplasmic adaptor subunit [Lichenicoccus sp.]|uniref:efflux RND transporter periplasmic adaptor subunit n=1 Tax=Lichenicoccus sp. TaxID=2781899 RepID=UPI003D1527B7
MKIKLLLFPMMGVVLLAAAPPAPSVSTVIAKRELWQAQVRATGQVVAVQGADLSAEVSGIVGAISFASGQDVAAGTVLLRLRPNDDDARLAQLQALASLGAANLARDRKQFTAEAVSRATLDADQSNLAAEQAQVAAQRAVMAEKAVRAPFAGRLGIRLVDLGQYLTAGTAIVTLQALDPIYVDFNVAQQALGRLHVGQTISAHLDGWPDRVFKARLSAINSRLDAASRMATVRAELDNHDHALLPGMFAVVDVDTGAAIPRLTLPQAAISFNPYGDFVYVLERGAGGQLIANSRVVATGAVRGDQVAILSGIKAGEQVVSAGQLKLRSGMPVEVNNSIQPPDNAAPNVANE